MGRADKYICSEVMSLRPHAKYYPFGLSLLSKKNYLLFFVNSIQLKIFSCVLNLKFIVSRLKYLLADILLFLVLLNCSIQKRIAKRERKLVSIGGPYSRGRFLIR